MINTSRGLVKCTNSTWEELPFSPPTKPVKTRGQRRRDRFQGNPVHETVPIPSLENGEQVPIPANIRELHHHNQIGSVIWKSKSLGLGKAYCTAMGKKISSWCA